MWNDFRKAVPGKELAGLASALASGHPGQGSFHAIIYQFLKVRGHFLGRVFAVGYWINNQGQTEESTPGLVRGQPGGYCSGLAR